MLSFKGACMRVKLVLLVLLGAIAAFGQGKGQPADPTRTPGVQGPADPNHAAFVAANCKVPPPAAGGGAGRAGGGAAPPVATFQEVSSLEIPGIIAAGQKWKVLWED